jgi:hypothetical protein
MAATEGTEGTGQTLETNNGLVEEEEAGAEEMEE